MRQHKRTFSMAAVLVSSLAAAALAASCARRPHTSSDFGASKRALFDRQARAAYSGSAQGLDSEEASGIHQQYRQGLGKRGAQSAPDPKSSVLLIQEDKRDSARRP